MPRHEFTILGAGVMGLLTSVMLAEKGYRVKLIEPRYPGAGATGASAGLIVLHLKRSLLELALDSLNVYRRYLGRGGYLVNIGALLFTRDTGCMKGYRRVMEDLGLSFKLLTPEEAEEHAGVPLNIEDDEHVALVDEYLLDVGHMVTRLHSLLGELGATVVDPRRDDKWEGEVIVAAGAWTPQILPELRDKVVVYRCQATAYQAPTPQTALEDDVNGYYSVTHPGGDLVAGDGMNKIIQDPQDGYTPDPWEPYQILERLARRVKGAEHGYPRRTWAAPCITSLDSLPIAGRVREDVYVATALNGLGITLAGGIAVRLIDSIIKGTGMGLLDPGRELRRRPLNAPPEPYDECPRLG